MVLSVSRASRWSIISSMIAGITFSILGFLWVPWERVHPNDTTLRETIGYAPAWSHRFDAVAGARIDWKDFLLNLMLIWVICGAAAVMLTMSGPND